jgi:hypothetical protein
MQSIQLQEESYDTFPQSQSGNLNTDSNKVRYIGSIQTELHQRTKIFINKVNKCGRKVGSYDRPYLPSVALIASELYLLL